MWLIFNIDEIYFKYCNIVDKYVMQTFNLCKLIWRFNIAFSNINFEKRWSLMTIMFQMSLFFE